MLTLLIAYAAIGVIIGLLSGLFGVGGSSISTPVLRILLDVPSLIALATPLPVTVPTAIAGGLTYYRRGAVRKDVVVWCTLAGIPAVIAGAVATHFIGGYWLMLLTGVVTMAIGGHVAWSAVASRTVDRQALHPLSGARVKLLSALVGVAVGFFSGLLANGGGFLLVPAFILVLGLSMHEAAGTSLICAAGLAVPGSITHWVLGHIDPVIMLSLGAAVIPASYLGARVALRLRSSQVQLLFGLFLVLFSCYFLYSEVARTVVFP